MVIMIVLEGNPLANAAADDAKSRCRPSRYRAEDCRFASSVGEGYSITSPPSYMSGRRQILRRMQRFDKFGLLLERMFSFGEEDNHGHYAKTCLPG